MSRSKYLITGGLGYIGSVLTDELVRQGAEIVVLDNGFSGRSPQNSESVTYVQADLRNAGEWDAHFIGVDGVVHLAAIVGDPACNLDPALAWETNYLATVNVASACRKANIRRLVFTSTCSNYGLSFGKMAEVWSPLHPQSVYAESKVRAEHHLLSVRDQSFTPCILRFATVYGLSPRMRFDLAVNVMTAKAVLSKDIVVHGGSQWRPFLHVRDAAGAIMAALAAEPNETAEIYNCGSNDENYRLIDVADLIRGQVRDAAISVDLELSDSRDYQVNFAQITEELGFECQHRLVEGIREMSDAIRMGAYDDFTEAKYSNHLTMQAYLGSIDLIESELERAAG